MTLVNTLEQHNKAVYSSQDQRKYVESLDHQLFLLWEHISNLAASGAVLDQFKAFINGNSLILLQTWTEYLRKELKIPEYSEMTEDVENFELNT